MQRTSFLALIFLVVAGCGGDSSSPSSPAPLPPTPPLPIGGGLDLRPTNLTCMAPDKSGGGPAPIDVVNAFPNLNFDQPLFLTQAPADDSRWFVVERAGRVRVFDNDPAVASMQTLIDIAARVDSGPGEAGLLGVAFHPEFASNREVFLSYTEDGSPLVSVISRFRSLDGGMTLDPGSEETILRVNQDFGNHNGGQISFGPDGYLYIGLGDGGSGGDPRDRAQDTTNLLGALLRLDVGAGAPYAVPLDNPFAGNPMCAADHTSMQSCPEIYAWGLRNPWRWSFDRNTGDLWLGDVGQNNWEEIDRIQRGGNYGWDCREGANPHSGAAASCPAGGMIDPIAQYDHTEGFSVTGGFVYRGSAVPALAGRYLFADFVTSTLWALSDDGQGGYTREVLDSLNFGVSSFGEGNDGEVYVVDYGGQPNTGRIMQVIDGGGGAGNPSPLPDLLSDTGCVSSTDPSQPAVGLIPYAVQVPFWSDGALKERWLAIPDGTVISVDVNTGDFQFPNGTVLMKHFRLGARLTETRLFMRHPDGDWAGYTYEWNGQGTDANLVRGGRLVNISGQDWTFPSETDCLVCHTQVAGFSLGLEVSQLNGDLSYPSTSRTANQLLTLDAVAMFSAPLGDPGGLPVLPDPTDGTVTLDERARAYLESNCVGCHQPGGPTPANLDLRFETQLGDTNTCDVPPQAGELGINNARIVAPGEPDRSVLVERMVRRDVNAMPPIASNVVDTDGVTLIRDWISGLSGC